MNGIGVLKNTIQEYAWGSMTAIPELLGQEVSASKPQAELWMGAHPKAPSMVKVNGEWRSLAALIAADPQGALGETTAERYQGKLPYLLKVLAAAKPLSIQAHPSREQAQTGFKRENELRIPLDAPERNYRDDNHKPELICALTDFWVLSGFRRIRDIISLLETTCPESLAVEIGALERRPDSAGRKQFYYSLLSLDQDRRREVVQEAVQRAKSSTDESTVHEWLLRLAAEYPEDIGVLSPLILNLILLRPGEAMFLPSGVLHAYLRGMGIELMANSDNVLRGGLTPKHVDVPELLKVLRFEDGAPDIVAADETRRAERIFAAPAAEFVLSVISLKTGETYSSPSKRAIEIVLCTEGEGAIKDTVMDDVTPLRRGTSVVIPASVKSYEIKGNVTLYKAGVPL